MTTMLYYEELMADLMQEKSFLGSPSISGLPACAVPTFRDELREGLGVGLPEEYLTFLLRANGFNFNGVFLYAMDGTQDLLPELMRENYVLATYDGASPERIVIGHSDFDHFLWNVLEQSWQALDQESGLPSADIQSFNDLITYMLEEALGLDYE